MINDAYLTTHIEEGEDTGAPDEGSVTVIDIVDAHRLKEIELDKKAWTAYIKGRFFSTSRSY
jgi:hypothetical protein